MSSAQRYFLLALCLAGFLFSLVVITASRMAGDPLQQVDGGSFDLPGRILADDPAQAPTGGA